MNNRKLLQQVIGLALVVWLLPRCSGGVSTEPTATPAPVVSTEIIVYAPPVPSEEREGSCGAASDSVVREGSWRCTVGGEVFDPCFVADDGETIVCGTGPGMDTPGFKLKLTEPLPSSFEWFEWPDALPIAHVVELADGTLCECEMGWLGVEEKRFHCTCAGDSEGDDVVMLGDLQPGSVWRAEKAILGHTDSGYFIKESETVAIRTVWR